MTFRNPILGAGGSTLLRPAIQSPNYQPGVSGWAVKRGGDAEFNNLKLRGQYMGTDYEINANGIFLYSGTPGAGNLVGSWATAAGTDEYGNAYPLGLQISAGAIGSVLLDPTDGRFLSNGSSGDQVAIGDGAIVFNQASQTSQALIEQNLDRTHGSLYLSGGSLNAADVQTLLGLVTSYGAPVAGTTDSYPRSSTRAYSGTVAAHHYVTGAVVKTSDLTGDTAEVKHSPALGSGWASGPVGGSYRGLQYWKDAMDNLVISGVIHTNSATPSAVLFTLPAGYIPKGGERPGVICNAGGTYSARSIEIDKTAGTVTIDPVPTVTNMDAYIYATVPMGAYT